MNPVLDASRQRECVRAKRGLELVLILVGLLAFSSCGDDEMGPDSDGFPPDPDRSSPQALLTDWFVTAYTRQDTALYKEMLDGSFEFEFLPEDADSLRDYLGPDNAWDRDLDIESTRGLFASTVITDITLNISVTSEIPFTGAGCDSCRLVESVVTLRVGTTEASQGTPLVLSVDSPQEFIVKRDPANAGEWVLFRQEDRPRGKRSSKEAGSGDAPSASATENTTWGNIKGLHPPALHINPLTCSISGSPLSGDAPLEVGFGGTFSGGHGPYTLSWAFGDGVTSASLNPSHVFQNPGIYTTVFTVRDAQATPLVCRDTLLIEVAEPPPNRSTPDALLTDWFEKAYFTEDSILYEGMLDDEFQFEFLPEDADSLRELLGQFNYWGKTPDLNSTGGLFRNNIVTDITLDIAVTSNVPYVGEGCAGCREIESMIILHVTTTETTGGTPFVFAVDSPQTFITKKDAADTTQWVLWRQYDRPQSFKRGGDGARAFSTEGKSWGQVKGLFQ